MSVMELVYRLSEGCFCIFDLVYFSFFTNSSSIKSGKLEVSRNIGTDSLEFKYEIIKLFSKTSDLTLPFNNNLFFKRVILTKNFDLRLYWESQRFNDLIICAIRNEPDIIFSKLTAWNENNPPLRGCNYISTMECAIRCINLHAAMSILKASGSLHDNLTRTAATFFYVNYRLIKHRISKFSSRGNHTLFEYAGLVVCSYTLGLASKSYWLDKFFSELRFQVNGDGSGIEQSTGYHLFNLDLAYFISSYFSSESVKSDLFDSAVNFSSHFFHKDSLVRFGDCDSSVLLTRVFVTESINKQNHIMHPVVNFPDTGLVIMNCNHFKAILKYGALGMSPLYGHGHYDFLSICLLTPDGELITADSQTYLYNFSLRKEFRSSLYHSMPTVGEDDVKQGSYFSWENNAQGKLLYFDNDCLYAEYRRYDEKKLSRMLIRYENHLIIIDSIAQIDPNFKTQMIWNDDKTRVQYYLLGHEGELVQVLPIEEQVDFSPSYGIIKSNVSLRHTLFSERSNSIVTVLNFGSDYVSKSTLGEIISYYKGIV